VLLKGNGFFRPTPVAPAAPDANFVSLQDRSIVGAAVDDFKVAQYRVGPDSTHGPRWLTLSTVAFKMLVGLASDSLLITATGTRVTAAQIIDPEPLYFVAFRAPTPN
jgi:hypothetical protein